MMGRYRRDPEPLGCAVLLALVVILLALGTWLDSCQSARQKREVEQCIADGGEPLIDNSRTSRNVICTKPR